MALERAGLERWYKGDPMGILELCDTNVTYFDPTVPARIDGLKALKEHFLPLIGKVMVDHYEIQNPKVQVHGDAAILTYNLVVYVPQEDGTDKPMYFWNAADVYALIDGSWKVVHSNWAHTKPVDSLV